MWSRVPLLRCFAFYRPHWRILLVATAVMAVANLLMPFTFVILGQALTDLKSGAGVDAAWHWSIALLALAFGRGLVQYLGTVLSIMAGQRLLHDLRLAIFTQVQRLDPAWHAIHGSGEIVSRTTRDSDQVRDAITGGWRTIVELVVMVVSVLATLWWYHPLLGVVPTVLTLIGMTLVVRQGWAIARLDAQAGDAYDGVLQDIDEGVRGVRVVKAFSLEASRATRFSGHLATYERFELATGWFIATRQPLPQFIVALGHVWVFVAGAWLIANGLTGVGTLVAALLLVQMIIFRVEAVGNLQQMLAKAHASAERIIAVLDAQPALATGHKALPGAPAKSAAGAAQPPLGLRLEHVRVALGGRNVLDGCDLTIRPGEIVALVGPTGSGKSTLAALASRLRDPDAGRVLIGSDATGWTDARQLDRDALRRAVQVVFQDAFLFSDTVAANLRRARPDADDAALDRAIAQAVAGDVLATLPDGLASKVGERGVTLSGGQRQRLCLARALVARPAILVADDATSALDAVTEQKILDGLRAAGDHPTLLLIAGKLSTILLADRVALLDQGRIVASGSHEELLENSPAYRDLLGLDKSAAVGRVS